MRKANPILFASVAAVLLLSSLDCFAPRVVDAQAMECCANMPCTPAFSNQDCCQTMVSDPSLYVLPPAAHPGVALTAVATLPIAHPSAAPARGSEVRLESASSGRAHAPPRELYTVYVSLLI